MPVILKNIIYIRIFLLRPIMAQGQKRVNATDYGCEKKIKYLTMSFHSGRRGVEFRHSTSNASRIQRKVENENLSM